MASVTPTGPVSFCPGSGSLLTASAGSALPTSGMKAVRQYPALRPPPIPRQRRELFCCYYRHRRLPQRLEYRKCLAEPVPTPSITASGPLTFCAPGSVTLTESSGTGTIYQWYFDATAIAGANGVSYTASISGSYKLVLTNASGCSATSATSIVLANPTPSSIVAPPGPIALCGGGSAILSAATGAGYMYQWYNSGGPITGETGATYTATSQTTTMLP